MLGGGVSSNSSILLWYISVGGSCRYITELEFQISVQKVQWAACPKVTEVAWPMRSGLKAFSLHIRAKCTQTSESVNRQGYHMLCKYQNTAAFMLENTAE